MKSTVYRCYDGNGILLYVGNSIALPARLRSHRDYSDWYSRVRRIEVSHHRSRSAGLRAEQAEIRGRKPKLNRQHATYRRKKKRPLSMLKATFGSVIKKERERQGLTQAEAARRCGVSKQYLFQLERFDRFPSLDKADMILKGLGLSAVIGTLDRRKRVSLDS